MLTIGSPNQILALWKAMTNRARTQVAEDHLWPLLIGQDQTLDPAQPILATLEVRKPDEAPCSEARKPDEAQCSEAQKLGEAPCLVVQVGAALRRVEA
jgi:hypothetical protein